MLGLLKGIGQGFWLNDWRKFLMGKVKPVGKKYIRYKLNQRVIHKDGSIGNIEDPGDGYVCDVRWLTPNNNPSCCICMCWCEDLKQADDNVVPFPKNEEWWYMAKKFHEFVTNKLISVGNQED